MRKCDSRLASWPSSRERFSSEFACLLIGWDLPLAWFSVVLHWKGLSSSVSVLLFFLSLYAGCLSDLFGGKV